MKVFISRSGTRSKSVAEALQKWLRLVIQAVDPGISTEMAKGTKWGPEIADRLEESKVGIICLTRDNLTAPWILFEAGAISKSKDAHVCTFLLDVQPAKSASADGSYGIALEGRPAARHEVGSRREGPHLLPHRVPGSHQDCACRPAVLRERERRPVGGVFSSS